MFRCVSVWECVWPLTQLHLHSNELHSRERVWEKDKICVCVWGGRVRRMIAQHQHVNEHQLWTCILMANLLLTSDYTLYIVSNITVRANQKLWLTGEVYRLLKARNAAFRAGDEEGLRTARANLSRGIREAKRQYSRRIAHRFSDSRDTRSLWQGIQTITDYKPPPQTCDSTIPLLTSWMPSLLALRHKTAPLHRRLHLLPATRWWRCPRTAWGDPSAGSMHAKLRVLTTFLGVYWETVQWNSLMSSQTFSTSH